MDVGDRLHGFIDEVRIDGLLAQVRLRVADQWLTTVITADEVRALTLGCGDDAIAIVRPTQVMIGRAATTDAHVIPGRMTRRRQRRWLALLRATSTGRAPSVGTNDHVVGFHVGVGRDGVPHCEPA